MFVVIMLLVHVLLSSAGAYFIANAICQRRWREKIPQAKLIGFTTIFVVCFVTLTILLGYALALRFGR